MLFQPAHFFERLAIPKENQKGKASRKASLEEKEKANLKVKVKARKEAGKERKGASLAAKDLLKLEKDW